MAGFSPLTVSKLTIGVEAIDGQAPPIAPTTISQVQQRLSCQQFGVCSSQALPLTTPPHIATTYPAEGKTLKTINAALLKHKFASHQFCAFLHNALQPHHHYSQLNRLSSSELAEDNQDLSTFVEAMFPTDMQSEQGFALDPLTIDIIKSTQQAINAHTIAFKKLLPSLQLTLFDDKIRLCLDFDFKQCQQMHTANGRLRLASIIRSLFLLGNKNIAFQLRDVLLSIGKRYRLKPQQLAIIATSCEKDFWQKIALFNKDEALAQQAINNVAFSLPSNSTVAFSPDLSPFMLQTGNQVADHMLGFPTYGIGIRDQLKKHDLSQIEPDSLWFEHFYPASPFDSGFQPMQSRINRELRYIFAANPLLRHIHRQITDHVMPRFGLMRYAKNKVKAFATQFEPKWLQNTPSGQAERQLLLKIIKRLYWLRNQTLAENLRKIVWYNLQAKSLNSEDFVSPFADIPPLTTKLTKIKSTKVVTKFKSLSQQLQALPAIEAEHDDDSTFAKVVGLAFPIPEESVSAPHLVLLDDSVKAELKQSNIKNKRETILNEVLAAFQFHIALDGFSIEQKKPSKKLAYCLQDIPYARQSVVRLIRSLRFSGEALLANNIKEAFIQQGLAENLSNLVLIDWHYAMMPKKNLAQKPTTELKARKQISTIYQRLTPEQNAKNSTSLTVPFDSIKSKNALERYKSYLESEDFENHQRGLFSTYNESWPSLAMRIFAVEEGTKLASSAPSFNSAIKHYVENTPQALVKQMQLFKLIINQFGLELKGNAFLPIKSQDFLTSDFFNPQTPLPKVITQILRHFAATKRLELATK